MVQGSSEIGSGPTEYSYCDWDTKMPGKSERSSGGSLEGENTERFGELLHSASTSLAN